MRVKTYKEVDRADLIYYADKRLKERLLYARLQWSTRNQIYKSKSGVPREMEIIFSQLDIAIGKDNNGTRMFLRLKKQHFAAIKAAYNEYYSLVNKGVYCNWMPKDLEAKIKLCSGYLYGYPVCSVCKKRHKSLRNKQRR